MAQICASSRVFIVLYHMPNKAKPILELLDGFLDKHGTFERFFFLAVHLRSHYHEQAQTELKVVIIGDYGVGKTSFIKRHINGFLSKKFLKEHGCHVVPMMFSTNKSTFLLQVVTLL
jgi:polynucleotide 5'-kinase involved in rRNA processing